MCLTENIVYNVSFNSFLGTGANTQSLNYFFDWGIFKEGEYKVTWTMATSQYQFANPSIYSPLYVQIDLGQLTYPVNYYPKIIGCANTPNLSNNLLTYYYASDIMNPSFIIKERPKQNNITINLYQNTAANGYQPFNINPAAGTIGSYIIVFHFELLKEKNIE